MSTDSNNSLPSYIDFINTEDERFKLGLLWWYTLPSDILTSDYEFSWKFLQKNVSLDEIKTVLKERLLDLLVYSNHHGENFKYNCLRKLIKRYYNWFIEPKRDTIMNICEMLFRLVYDDMYHNGKDSFILFNCWNRVIRNFRDAHIVSDANIHCMKYVDEYRKSRQYKNINCGW